VCLRSPQAAVYFLSPGVSPSDCERLFPARNLFDSFRQEIESTFALARKSYLLHDPPKSSCVLSSSNDSPDDVRANRAPETLSSSGFRFALNPRPWLSRPSGRIEFPYLRNPSTGEPRCSYHAPSLPVSFSLSLPFVGAISSLPNLSGWPSIPYECVILTFWSPSPFRPTDSIPPAQRGPGRANFDPVAMGPSSTPSMVLGSASPRPFFNQTEVQLPRIEVRQTLLPHDCRSLTPA